LLLLGLLELLGLLGGLLELLGLLLGLLRLLGLLVVLLGLLGLLVVLLGRVDCNLKAVGRYILDGCFHELHIVLKPRDLIQCDFRNLLVLASFHVMVLCVN
jgi:hypothetical protein